MPNHITTELIASPGVIEALTRNLTPDEIKSQREDYEAQVERIAKRGDMAYGDYTPTPPDDKRRLVDFALVIPEPDRMFHGGCNGQHPHPHPDGGVYDHCWYNWNVENWGTKWNAYDVAWEDLDDGRVQLNFDTAWSHPEPVITALSKKFPYEVLEVRYADEDLGSNCGTYKIRDGIAYDGVIDPGGDEALELACDIKYGVPYAEKKREWDTEEAEWEFRQSVYDRFQEEAGLPERPESLPYGDFTDDERAARRAEQNKWHEAYQEVMRKGDEFIKNLEEAEVRSAIDSILTARADD